MGTETLAELEKAAQEIRDGLKNVNEDIKKLTGRDPSDNSTRPMNRRVQLKRNAFNNNSRQTEPQTKQRRDSISSNTRRWGRTFDSGLRTSVDEDKLESSGDEDESSKPAIQSVIATELKPARIQTKETEDDTKTKSRNRRMFGFLVGTLQRFKEDTRQKTLGEKRREEIEKKLEEKAEEEKKEVSSQRRELFQSRREKQHELKTLERKLENAILKEDVSAHYVQLGQFIKSKSEPHIFYLPVKHNDATKKLLDESTKALKDLQESRFKAIDDLDEGFVTAMFNKGKTSKAEESRVKDVGHRDLFDEEREQDDLEKEGDVMMDGDRRDNVEWNKMEGNVEKVGEQVNDDCFEGGTAGSDERGEKHEVPMESESSEKNVDRGATDAEGNGIGSSESDRMQESEAIGGEDNGRIIEDEAKIQDINAGNDEGREIVNVESSTHDTSMENREGDGLAEHSTSNAVDDHSQVRTGEDVNSLDKREAAV